MKGIHVTSAYPVTWMRKDWSPQEERLAKEVDGMFICRYMYVYLNIYVFIYVYL
jgi:hypothetical protein